MIKFLERIFKPILMPFKRKVLLPLKSLKKLPIIVAKKIRALIKGLLKTKETSLKNYLKFGRYYVAKKLLVIIALVIGIFIYFLFIKPPALVNKLFNKPTVLVEQTERASAFSGKAKIYNEDGQLVYEGDLSDGLYTGYGKLYNEQNELIYKGNFQDGLKHGFGEEYFAETGTVMYRGNFENGMKQGNGETFHRDNYLLYKGEHSNDTMTGNGEVFDRDGNVIYKGEIVNGQYSGEGRLYESNKLRYEGQFHNGKFSGNGVEYTTSGKIKYEGEFQNGQYGGQGTTYFSNGNILYEGQFINGQYSGLGTLYYMNGLVKYEGEYLLGVYNGTGVSYDKNGQKIYEGQFRKGKYEGSGSLYNDEEMLVYEGEFKDGQYHQVGSLFNEEGHLIYKGYFDRGELAPWKFLGLVPSRISDIYDEPTEVIVEASLNEAIASIASGGEEPLPFPDDEQVDDGEEPIEKFPATFVYEESGLFFYIEASEEDQIPRVTEVLIRNKQIAELILTEIEEKYKSDKKQTLVKSKIDDPNYDQVIIYRQDDIVYQFQYVSQNKLDSVIINGTLNEQPPMK